MHLLTFLLSAMLLIVLPASRVLADNCPPDRQFQFFVDRKVAMSGPLNPDQLPSVPGRQWQQMMADWRQHGGELYALRFGKKAGEGVLSANGVDGYALFRQQCAVHRLVMPQQGKVTLPAQRAVFERCLPLDAGQTLAYRFTASAPVHFNLHYHQGDKTVYPVKANGLREKQGSYRVEEKQFYCLMWRSESSQPVVVDMAFGLE